MKSRAMATDSAIATAAFSAALFSLVPGATKSTFATGPSPFSDLYSVNV